MQGQFLRSSWIAGLGLKVQDLGSATSSAGTAGMLLLMLPPVFKVKHSENDNNKHVTTLSGSVLVWVAVNELKCKLLQ